MWCTTATTRSTIPDLTQTIIIEQLAKQDEIQGKSIFPLNLTTIAATMQWYNLYFDHSPKKIRV